MKRFNSSFSRIMEATHYKDSSVFATHLKNCVEHYTGEKANIVDWMADPKVPNAFAVKAEILAKNFDNPIYFLFTNFGMKTPVDEAAQEHMEEVEFSQWPPTSGELRFFL